MDWKKALPIVTIVLVILAGVFLALDMKLTEIDVSTVPTLLQGIFTYVKTVFGSGALALGLVWLRNIFGYLEAYARAKAEGNPGIEYNFGKFYKTAAYYLGNTAVIFNLAPTAELRAVGVAIVFFIDLLGSILAKIFARQGSS